MKQTAAEWSRDRDHARQFPGARGTFGGNRIPSSYLARFSTIGSQPDDPEALPYELEAFVRKEL